MRSLQRYGLLGHPLDHSISPAMHEAAFAALGVAGTYEAIDVPTARELSRRLDELREGRLSGVNVTIPYKRVVLELVDEVAESAAQVGAANVLTRGPSGRVVAHNTDADALAAEIELLRGGGQAMSAVVIGAGGAGLAAIAACRKAGYTLIGVTTRSWVNSESLVLSSTAVDARALGALTSPWPGVDNETAPTSRSSWVLRHQWCELASTADLIVQASSAGMAGADPGEDLAAMVPWDMLPAHAVAYDVVYYPAATPFVREARARGLRAESGLGMLVGQAARAFTLWTGKEAPVDVMRRAAHEALAARDLERADLAPGDAEP
jgi:shikimate 5-dehydrogenase